MKPAKPARTPKRKSISERKRDSMAARSARRGGSTPAQRPAESGDGWDEYPQDRYREQM
jgi:hypothetical protein